MSRTFYIETVGCQMNTLDSELVTASLLREGYIPAESPWHADVLLFNTCSIRQHAEDKIYSALGRLKNAKIHHPHKIIGVLGCMAQKDAQSIFRRAPHVDLVIGPGQIARVPELIHRVETGMGPQLELSLTRNLSSRHDVEASYMKYDPMRDLPARESRFQALVRIMFGCDQFCTYCIVPSVRGPEQSRPADEIIQEVRTLGEQGCVEVTLIGQTVSRYADTSSGNTPIRLAQLLEKLEPLCEVTSLKRIRFVTSHPNSMTDDLLCAVRDLPHVLPYFHVPAQSGSDAVLKRMKRGYTVSQYRDMLSRIRETVPNAAITSDFIVGFCGETENEFQDSMNLVRDGRFKNSFIFKYSPREGTKSWQLMQDDVPDQIKRQRNNEMLQLQNQISEEDNQPLVGKTLEILVEGVSKNALKLVSDTPEMPEMETLNTSVQLTGRTVCDRIVVFNGSPELTGKILPIKIVKASPFTLFGEL